MKTVKYTGLVLILSYALTLTVPLQAQNNSAKLNAPTQLNLMPIPASLQMQPGRLPVSASFNVAIKNYADDRLRAGIARMLTRLAGRTVLTLPADLASDENTAVLVVQCERAGDLVPSLTENESYSLEVTDRQARLTAPTVVGALRGLETVLQLLQGDRDGYYLPGIKIQDQPRFPWRGLLIDVGRHYEPVEVLKRNLDAMAAVKLNVFHWHLTEDQGFRVESKKLPKLHTLGSDGLYYTQDQVREIINYARERGIRVMPEFDIPGHSTSWLVGHPEMGSAPGPYKIERGAGIFEPALDPTREQTYKFLDTFLGEMAELFPDAYMHIGGDENEGKQWDRNSQIQAFMKEKGIKDNHALQAYFNQRVLKILQKHGKKMIGWEEILHPDLPKDAVIHSWRGPASLAEAAKKGYHGILSAGYYIDLVFPAAQHYVADPIPLDTTLTTEEAKFILGGEATMWGEWVSPETIDSRIWPRTAAIAERLWSPRNVTDVEDMYRRLGVIGRQLEELGLTHEKNYGMLLRRLTASDNTAPLRTLASIVEPVKEYHRYQMRPQTMLSPLTGLVDTARPDSETARQFAANVDAFLSDAPRFAIYRPNLEYTLGEWLTASRDLGPIIDRSPALQEARPLVSNLRDIGETGLEAITHLSSGDPVTPEWRDASLAKLDEAAKPKAALEFVVITSVRKLVIAAAELPQLKTTAPAEWKKQVTTLATPAVTHKP
ncbi:MAG TPA: family 20 glycosylhydrolase [Pyrinomonadaceae bacterium]|nr:family 20 glycosylhydrolase [Pyrinomonadaceae bacterium]